jgi:hypothetical protein
VPELSLNGVVVVKRPILAGLCAAILALVVVGAVGAEPQDGGSTVAPASSGTRAL